MNLQVPIVIPSMSVETGRPELIQPRALYPKRGRRGCDKADSDRILYIYELRCTSRRAGIKRERGREQRVRCDRDRGVCYPRQFLGYRR